MKNWVHPNTIVGSTAEGNKYFYRTEIEGKLWREIDKGNNILFSAPRRVGKSSIMKYMAKNHDSQYSCIYENISSDASTKDFYRRILVLVLRNIKGSRKSFEKLKTWLGSIEIDEIKDSGVKFKSKDINYKKRLLELLPKLKEAEINIVLFLDEFPDVIKNISEKEGTEAARDILQTLRSLRHDDGFKGHFTLVLAGSIGLDHVVKSIDRIAVINDLNEQNLPALNPTETKEFIAHLVKDASMVVNDDCRNYVLNRLQQLIPYYIQLIIEECDDILFREQREELAQEDIDRAWLNVIKVHKHFSDWDDRLKSYFPNDYAFFVEVLKVCAHHKSVSIQEVYDMAIKFDLAIEYKAKIDDVLIKDGYLSQDGNKFKFVSPLLQEWWKNRHPLII